MKKILFFALPLTFLMACGGDKAAEEVVKLETFKDKLSYSLGAEHARMLLESGDPNLARYDYDKIIEGFKMGVKTDEIFDKKCQEVMRKMYGPQGQDFDTTYLEEACICNGKYLGAIFHKNWKKVDALDQIDMDMVAIGIKQAFEKRDTLISKEDRNEILNNFIIDINKKNGGKMLDAAKKLPNTQVTPDGIVIQTVSAGKGGSPSATDDVKVDYILTTPQGDTVESSLKARSPEMPAQPLSINLGSVIPGWTKAFPLLKKGGKYRIFIPGELASGAQQGFQSLCFYIDFHDFGKAGTLAQPPAEDPRH